MPSKGPVTEIEREYVRAKFPQMSVAEIARRMGRSRACVNGVVRREGLREPCKRKPADPASEGAAPQDPLSRLKELRDMLRKSLKEASPKEMASLAREYRATVEAIGKMEGGDDDEAACALDAVAKSIAMRMSP